MPGRPPLPGRPPITDISQWVERFSSIAAVIATRFLHKAPELFAYQAVIIRAERKYGVSYDRQFRRKALRGKTLSGPPQMIACIVRLSLGEQGLSHGALTAYGTTIPPSTARRTRTNCGSHGTRGQHLGKDLLPLRSAAAPASCVGDLMKGDAGWQLADSPTPAGVLTRRSPAVRVTSGLRPPPSMHGHSTKHLIWQLSFINKCSSVEFMLA